MYDVTDRYSTNADNEAMHLSREAKIFEVEDHISRRGDLGRYLENHARIESLERHHLHLPSCARTDWNR